MSLFNDAQKLVLKHKGSGTKVRVTALLGENKILDLVEFNSLDCLTKYGRFRAYIGQAMINILGTPKATKIEVTFINEETAYWSNHILKRDSQTA